MASFHEFKSSFTSDSYQKGKAFERFLCNWFFTNHPLYRNKFKKVWLWEDWPKPAGIQAQDLGTDLIAEDTEGKICAIQAKFYDTDYKIRFEDVATFLADSSKPHIDYRLLIATCELGPNARKQISTQEKPVQTFLLNNFDSWEIDWPRSLEEISTAELRQPHEPRPHQARAIDDVCSKLSGRGKLIMACGTGKTLTAQRIAERLEARCTLLLLPSLLLLSKTLSDWLEHTKIGFSYLPVCSDSTVGKSADSETNFDAAELGCHSTTDPTEILSFLERPGNKVVFATYQSSGKIAEVFASHNLEPFDLIIADEAHRCAGKISSEYANVLDHQRLPSKNRLFMTATPRVFTPRLKKAAEDAEIQLASMDDEAVFGPVLHHLSFGEAIDQRLLSDYRVVVVGVDDEQCKQMVDERILVSTDTGIEQDARSFATQLGLVNAIREYDLRRVISFHSRVKAAANFTDQFSEVLGYVEDTYRPHGTITCDHVSGKMPTSERNNKLRALGALENEDRYLIANARCLSEGVDVPALDGVAFVDPRRSEVDIVQAVGRAIRLSADKNKGTIIIPVFLGDTDDPGAVLSNSDFNQVWKIVAALRAHDEQLGEALDQLRLGPGRGPSPAFPREKIILDIPTRITRAFSEAFEARLVEATSCNSYQSWEFWFGLLLRYKRQYGDCWVPQAFELEGFKLGVWVHHQRRSRHSLLPDIQHRLDALGFIWNVPEHQWQEGIKHLLIYREQFGHCDVPRGFEVAGFPLGKWVKKRRFEKKSLTPDRLQQLEDIGFAWRASTTRKGAQSWDRGFGCLQRYKEQYGDCLVPRQFKLDEFALGEWVWKQRASRDSLTYDRLQRLEAIGFIWNVSEHYWEQGFEHLQRYRDRYGDCLVPNYFESDGFRLGQWVANQRRQTASLTPARQQRLDALGFVWDVLGFKWEQGFSFLQRYKEKYGDCLIPSGYELDGFKLGRWVERQRRDKDSLALDRLQRLSDIGFVWDARKHKP